MPTGPKMMRRSHGTQERFGERIGAWRGADHNRQRTAARAGRAAAHRRVNEVDSALGEPLCKAAGSDGGDRRHIDDQQAGFRPGGDTRRTEDRLLDLGCVRNAEHDGIAGAVQVPPGSQLRTRRARASGLTRRGADKRSPLPHIRLDATRRPSARPLHPARRSRCAKSRAASLGCGLRITFGARRSRRHYDSNRSTPDRSTDVRCDESLHRQTHAPSPFHVRARAGERNADDAADRSGSRARARRLLR